MYDTATSEFCFGLILIGMFVLPPLGVIFLQWYVREMEKLDRQQIENKHKRRQ